MRGLNLTARGSNESVPEYIALCGESYVESDDDLAGLVRLLTEEIVSADSDQDVVVWHGGAVAAVLQSDGCVIWLERP
jgi:hypothetical protein